MGRSHIKYEKDQLCEDSSSMKKDWLYVDATSSMKKDQLCEDRSSMKKDSSMYMTHLL